MRVHAMNRLQRKYIQQGFTLIEFMVVMALISMAIAMVVLQFGEVNQQRLATRAFEDMNSVINAIRMQRDRLNGYTYISEAQVAKSPGFPSRLCVSGDCTGGQIDLGPLGSVYSIKPYGKGFQIVVGIMADIYCADVASKLIYGVDEILVSSSATISTGAVSVLRSTVLASASTKPAVDYFSYVTAPAACTKGIYKILWVRADQ